MIDILTVETATGQLELNGSVLPSGDWLELCIFGHWIPGQVCIDATGWYLQTLDYVGIRLRAGLRARILENPLVAGPSSEILRDIS